MNPSKPQGVITEMAIVDMFTRLIFEADAPLSKAERRVIDLVCLHDPCLAGAGCSDISEYLRAMTIEEMTDVVKELKTKLDQQQGVIAAKQSLKRHRLHH